MGNVGSGRPEDSKKPDLVVENGNNVHLHFNRLGSPLFADEFTSGANHLDFARVYIEMNVGSNFPDCFEVLSELRESFDVRVEYSWRPQASGSSNLNARSQKNHSRGHWKIRKDLLLRKRT